MSPQRILKYLMLHSMGEFPHLRKYNAGGHTRNSLAIYPRIRVKIGLENARAKGRQIGRKKLRDSDLIRKLLKAGMSYRAISSVARCSHGSVHAERVAMKKEEAELKKKLEEQANAEKAMQETNVVFPDLSQPAGQT